ncbi:MAG: OmpA family protein [Myxococcota bacterium]
MTITTSAPRSLAIGLLSALFLAPLGAVAQDSGNFSAERLAPAMSEEGIIDVESADIGGRLTFDTHLWLNYNKNSVRIRGIAPGDTQPGFGDVTGALVGDRFDANAIVSFGLWERFELGFDLPFTISQIRDKQYNAIRTLRGSGFGDMRVQPKLRLLKAKDAGIDVAVYAPIRIPSGGKANYFGEMDATGGPALAISREFSFGTRLALNGGFIFGPKVKPYGDAADPVRDDKFFWKFGVGHRFKKHSKIPLGLAISVGGELNTSGKPFDHADDYPLEFLGSAELDIHKEAQLFAGGGFALVKGDTAPDFRVFGGVRFFIRDRDKDGDGIEDDKDKCPDEPEDMDKIQDTDGCPETDADGDGVPDEKDGAPLDAEDKDGFQDDDGIPDPDNDGDKILDADDKCPNEAGPTENQGCPDKDSDGDGIIDRMDKCPSEAEDKDGYQDEDGCPDPDNDGDGVVDAKDQCIDKAGPLENRGCPDTDKDGDGIVDRIDNCPDEPGTADNHGCKAKQLVEITKEKIVIMDKVFFGTGAATILPKSFPLLNNVAQVLKAQQQIKMVTVEGHTDNVGKPEQNKALSQKRAESVVAYLVKQGVEPARLKAVGFGEEKPIQSNDTEAGRTENRRVEFTLGDGN